eukprot:TRINITY_DN2484_c0_g1_i1.p1 TRINITY_DN2484_c0_g1~~TRINITY_DN2484_c0_g1_i1.p1  ORF type:complete len:273 (-),score=42.90 TRINITY_DN2484_c0_g1_i1:114-932(-)
MIREVWNDNLREEMDTISELVKDYPLVAMDTEYPGIVARAMGNFKNQADFNYQTLRINVDLLNIIQLGLTFTDAEGNLPTDGICTWQFNFHFNLKEDIYAQDSISLLISSGIDFQKNSEDGIDPTLFGELLTSSGIVLEENIKWISFHSSYDFAYLIKLLTNQKLPAELEDFFDLVRLYFPCIYDVKYMMTSCRNLKGGLTELAKRLQIERIGQEHQAGSDSLLTSATFFKMKTLFFENNIDNSRYSGVLYGLGSPTVSAGAMWNGIHHSMR